VPQTRKLDTRGNRVAQRQQNRPNPNV